MLKYVVSKAAHSDLRAIARYTTERWGEDQATHYISSLRDCFQMLSAGPEIGRACDSISKGLRRHEHDKHVVFYRVGKKEIRILRVLHQRMLPMRSRFEP